MSFLHKGQVFFPLSFHLLRHSPWNKCPHLVGLFDRVSLTSPRQMEQGVILYYPGKVFSRYLTHLGGVYHMLSRDPLNSLVVVLSLVSRWRDLVIATIYDK